MGPVGNRRLYYRYTRNSMVRQLGQECPPTISKLLRANACQLRAGDLEMYKVSVDYCSLPAAGSKTRRPSASDEKGAT